MFPPPPVPTVDIEALPDIFGSISVACWVFVFTPQIYKNWKRGSTDGLATNFLVIWTAGDVCNVVGAIFQDVLPTMIILAMYYILADIALLGQVYVYGGRAPKGTESAGETAPLLGGGSSERRDSGVGQMSWVDRIKRQFHPEHSSPTAPLHDERYESGRVRSVRPRSMLQELWFYTYMVLLVFAAGLSGWYISAMVRHRHEKEHHHYHKHGESDSDPDPVDPLEFDIVGQAFGYLCAALYLGSRIPQILTNYRRKSTEALSLLFVIYACLGNITYDMSIFTYSPDANCQEGPGRCEEGEALGIYRRYLAINASWIIGSLGALLLDLIVFTQCIVYRKDEKEGSVGDVYDAEIARGSE